MFRESLLDSSPMRRNGKRWPMATAFIFESIAAALVIVIPLLSTGIIPVSARVPHVAPLQMVRVVQVRPHGDVIHATRHTAPRFPLFRYQTTLM